MIQAFLPPLIDMANNFPLVEKGWDMPQFAVDNVQRAIANGMLLQPSPQRLEYHTVTTKDGMEIMDNIFNNMSKFSI